MSLCLEIVPELLSICRLSPDCAIPRWASESRYFSVTRTPDELSIVCEQRLVPPDVKCEPNWRALRIKGTLDFALTGFLSSTSSPLSKAGISIFAISTFDTDYVLVKNDLLDQAKNVLIEAGFQINETPASMKEAQSSIRENP